MRLAKYLDTPRSIEIADWVFNNVDNGLRYYLPNQFFVDGSGFESTGYNRDITAA